MSKTTITPVQSIFSDLFDTNWFNEPIEKRIEKAFPAVNIQKKENSYHMELVSPGFDKDEIKVSVENEMLVVSAESKSEKKEKENNYTRKEFTQRSFKRAFYLPDSIDSDKINASYENGILKIDVPYSIKKQESKKEIAVR